jgi:DNA polymerase-4
LTASVGVATTKLVAKIASDLRKPDGLVVVAPGDEATFLAPLPIWRLWGVGEKTAAVLAEYGVKTIGDLAALPPDQLTRRFGKHGGSLALRAQGLDDDPVHEGDPAKSVGHEHTFDTDTLDAETIERTLLAMSEGVAGRLRSAGVRASTIAVKVRDSSFRTITRQRTLREPTDLTEPIYRAALELARPEVRGIRIRLLGVTASNLGEREQLAMFADEDPRRRKAIEATDTLRRRYGSGVVTRGRLVGSGLPAPFERDPRNPLDRRAQGVPTDPIDPDPDAPGPRDTLADTDVDDIPPDDS